MTEEITQKPPAPRRLWRSVRAMLAGVLTNVVLSTATDATMFATGIFSESMASSLFVIPTIYRTIFGILGSSVTARLAPYRPLAHAVILGILGTVLGSIGVAVAIGKPELGPLWYPIAICVTALPCAWIGGKLGSLSDHSS